MLVMSAMVVNEFRSTAGKTCRSANLHALQNCGAAEVLRRSKGFAAVLQRGKFRGTASFARGASEFIHNHGRNYEHCMSLPVVEEGETSECP